MTNSLNPTGAGLSEAASQFEALLTGEPDNQTQQAIEAVEDSEDTTESLEATTSEDETLPEADDQSDEDGAEDEEATDNAEDEDEDASNEDQLVTVRIDGEDKQIPLEEALRGYQRHSDYSRKMNEVVQDRKALEAEYEQVKTERAQYAELLGALQQQVQAAVSQEPNWEALYASDPLEYVRQKDLWREQKERLAAVAEEQQRLAQLQMQDRAEAISNLVRENQARLIEANPEWKDSKMWERDRAAIREYGMKLGFSEEELAQAYDHRAVMALYKAMKYDSIMAKRPQPQGRANAPKVAGAGTPASAPPTRAKSAVTNAKKRLAQSGKLGDAAALFETIL